MPLPSVCVRHSSSRHTLNGDTSRPSDNRLAVACNTLDVRLNLILSVASNCSFSEQTHVRLAYTRTACLVHVRPMCHQATAWSLEQTPRVGNHNIVLYPSCEMFCAWSRMRVATHCTCESHSTFAINNILLIVRHGMPIYASFVFPDSIRMIAFVRCLSMSNIYNFLSYW